MSNILLTKLLLGPGLVVAASLAGRRWGPAVSGILVAIPIVLGPILLIITIEHGEDFGTDTATSSLLALVALAVYVVVFERTGRSRPWGIATLAGWVSFLAVALALSNIDASPIVALVAALGAFAVAVYATPPPATAAGERTPPPAWDLPARAAATAVLIVVLTGAADELGPALAGALAPFPVATTVVAAFVLGQDGTAAATDMLRGFLRGIFGTVAFTFLVAVLIEPLGTAAAFTIGLAGTLGVQLVVLWAQRA
jgi:Ca2+/Na+ antiporter